MSHHLTTAARPLVMDPSAKAVLMALCDMARDPDDPDRPSQAWPPMRGQSGGVGLCDWTCLSERSVQRAMKMLIGGGHVTRRQLRHGVIYTVHPGGAASTPVILTPDNLTGDNMTPDILAATPVILAPKAPQSTNRRKKTSSSPSARADQTEWDALPVLPVGASDRQWADYAEMRCEMAKTSRPRRLWTPTIARKAIEKLHALAAAGSDPGAVLDQSVLNTWQGLFPVKDDRHGERNQSGGGGASGAGGYRGRTIDGFAAALNIVASGGRADHDGRG